MAAVPRPRTHAWRDVGASAALIALWIVPWLVITAATWVAGGRPSVSPLAFVNPGGIMRRLASGNGPFDWWVLVAPASSVLAWKFWASVALILFAGAAGYIAVRLRLAR